MNIKGISTIIILFSASICNAGNSIKDLGFNDKESEMYSLMMGNLACHAYGEYTNEIDAPILPQIHSKYALTMASMAFKEKLKLRYNKLSEKEPFKYKSIGIEEFTKERTLHVYNGTIGFLKDNYQKEGPKFLKRRIIEVMTDSEYTYPEWINNCNDMLNYTKSIIE